MEKFGCSMLENDAGDRRKEQKFESKLKTFTDARTRSWSDHNFAPISPDRQSNFSTPFAIHRSILYTDGDPCTITNELLDLVDIAKSSNSKVHEHGFQDDTVGRKAIAHEDSDIVLENYVPCLLWKFCDYPVSKFYVWSSAKPTLLRKQLELAFQNLGIEFFPVQHQMLAYRCTLYELGMKISFEIGTSILQSECQKEIGYKMIIEFTKKHCNCPSRWSDIFNEVCNELKDTVVIPDTVNKRTKNFEQNVFGMESQEPCSLRRCDNSSIDTPGVISAFVDATCVEDLSDTHVDFAEAFAEASSMISESNGHIETIRQGDIPKMTSLFLHCNFELMHFLCYILRNLAVYGWLECGPRAELDAIFKELVRTVNLVEFGGNKSFDLQSNALQALIPLVRLHKPSGYVAKLAKHTFERCALSVNTAIARSGIQLIELFNFDNH